MCNQVQEAARQILDQVSDIQAAISTTGASDVNLKLVNIRKNAALLLENKKGPEQIIAGYRAATQDSLITLGELIELHYGARNIMDDADLLQAMRLAEIFIDRGRIYFERKRRYKTALRDNNLHGETND